MDVIYHYRDIAWKEDGLEGTIPGVLVGVDAETDEIVLYPSEATPVIKAWREKVIRTRNLEQKREEQNRIQSQMAAAKNELERLKQLGLLDEDGCIDEEKYAEWQKRQDAPPPNYQALFGELRSALTETELEPRELFEVLEQLRELDPVRTREEAEAYMFEHLTRRTGRHMYEEKRLKAVYDWAYELLEREAERPLLKEALKEMAAGCLYMVDGGSPPISVSLSVSSVLNLPLGVLHWEPTPKTNTNWKLSGPHCHAIWAAINDWENKHGDS